jgi:L-serine/L-threonine ammonia-lyase
MLYDPAVTNSPDGKWDIRLMTVNIAHIICLVVVSQFRLPLAISVETQSSSVMSGEYPIAYSHNDKREEGNTSILSPKDLFLSTPLVKSEPLSRLLRTTTPRDVFIKLDNLQRSGSYKDRGMANLLWQSRATECEDAKSNVGCNSITHIVCSSGGNAGLAAATVARDLQLHCTVVVPKTTKSLVVAKLQSLHADVIVTGENWNEADAVARSMVHDDENNSTLYVPPFDHPLLWTGISSLVDEIYSEESFVDNPPSTIILSVGGGGLLCGVLEGLERTYGNKFSNQKRQFGMPTILCAETDGAASFDLTWKAGQVQSLEQITSLATSLGALTVTPCALERAQQYQSRYMSSDRGGGSISSAICSDAEAVDACLQVQFLCLLTNPTRLYSHVLSPLDHLFYALCKQFARDHRMLVEPACGAALAVLYSDRLRGRFFQSESTQLLGPVVIEICGGSGVTIDLLHEWKEKVLLNNI